METARLPIRSCIRYGWETFKKRPWFLIGAGLLIALIQIIIPGAEEDQALPVFLSLLAISFILGAFLQLGITSLMLRVHDSIESARIKDLWNPAPFWRYLGTLIITTVLVLLGLILLIVPGIIIGLGLSYASYLVIDKGLGPIAAIKESWRITKGNRWRLFLLMLVIVLLNILGLLALFVGLLVSIPVSVIAAIHAYRFLESAHAAALTEDSAPHTVTDSIPTTA